MTEQHKAQVIPLGLPDKVNTAPAGGLFQGIPVEKPTCPDWLSPEAKKHWRYIVKHLDDYGLISRLDQGGIAILATAYARMREAELEVQETGVTQKTPNNYEQVTPAFVAWKHYSAQYLKLATHYGLTVRARQTVKTTNPNQSELEL